MIKGLLKSKNFKNAGWIITGKVIQMGLSFIVGILSARYLGPSNYGLINYAAAYAGFFASICNLGIGSNIIVKELKDKNDQEGQILGTSIVLKGIASFLCAIMIICISIIVDFDEPLTIAVVALYSISILFKIFETFNYWFQARLDSKKTAFASLVAYSITSLYKIILLATGQPVTLFALATAVDYICIAIILFALYKKEGGKKLSFSFSYGKDIFKKSYHFILSGLMVAVYGQTDKLMLKQMVGESEIGYYSTATALCSLWCFVLEAIIDSIVPSIMEAHNIDKSRFERLNKQLYCIVFYVSMGVSVLFTIFGGIAINLLYGEAYLPAVNPLRVATWYIAFSYLGVARNAWLVCENKQRYLKYIYLIAAIANILLNLIFIPFFGATGAAIASLISQIMTSLVIPSFNKNMRQNAKLMVDAIFFRIR